MKSMSYEKDEVETSVWKIIFYVIYQNWVTHYFSNFRIFNSNNPQLIKSFDAKLSNYFKFNLEAMK